MKRRIFDIFFAMTIGVTSCYAFFSFYGIVVTSGTDEKVIKWISSLPELYRIYGLIIGEVFLQIASSLPSIAMLGIILGLVVETKPIYNGIISFIAFILHYIYMQFVQYDFGYTGLKYTPIWSYFIDITIWIGFFIFFPAIGYKMKTFISKHYKNAHSQPQH